MTDLRMSLAAKSSLLLFLLHGCGGRTDQGQYEASQQAQGGEDLGGSSFGGRLSATGGKAMPRNSGGSSTLYVGGTGYGGSVIYGTGGYTYYIYGGTTSTSTTIARGGVTSRGGATYTGGTRSSGGAATGGRGSGGYFPTGGLAGAVTAFAGYSATGGYGYAGFIGIAGADSVTGGSAGAPGVAGAAGCPPVSCARSCPAGLWVTAGCIECVCAPPNQSMTYDTLSCPTTSLTLSTGVSSVNGQWVFDFAWDCSASISGVIQSIAGSMQVAIAGDSYEIGQSLFEPSPIMSYIPIEFIAPKLVLSLTGGSPGNVELTPTTDSFLSIRRQGNRFVGGVYFVGTPGASTVYSTLSGPFDVQVPGT